MHEVWKYDHLTTLPSAELLHCLLALANLWETCSTELVILFCFIIHIHLHSHFYAQSLYVFLSPSQNTHLKNSTTFRRFSWHQSVWFRRWHACSLRLISTRVGKKRKEKLQCNCMHSPAPKSSIPSVKQICTLRWSHHEAMSKNDFQMFCFLTSKHHLILHTYVPPLRSITFFLGPE